MGEKRNEEFPGAPKLPPPGALKILPYDAKAHVKELQADVAAIEKRRVKEKGEIILKASQSYAELQTKYVERCKVLKEARAENARLRGLATCDHGVEWDTDCDVCMSTDAKVAKLVHHGILAENARLTRENKRLRGEIT